MKPCFIWNL